MRRAKSSAEETHLQAKLRGVDPAGTIEVDKAASNFILDYLTWCDDECSALSVEKGPGHVLCLLPLPMPRINPTRCRHVEEKMCLRKTQSGRRT
jgi:hypothetical protein